MKKGLIASFMVALILITILSAVVTANVVTVSKEIKNTEITDEKDNSSDWGGGFIMVSTERWVGGAIGYIPHPLVSFECKDLDTGKIRYRRTNHIGVCLLKYLPIQHDYMISIDSKYEKPPQIVNDLEIFSKVNFITIDRNDTYNLSLLNLLFQRLRI